AGAIGLHDRRQHRLGTGAAARRMGSVALRTRQRGLGGADRAARDRGAAAGWPLVSPSFERTREAARQAGPAGISVAAGATHDPRLAGTAVLEIFLSREHQQLLRVLSDPSLRF